MAPQLDILQQIVNVLRVQDLASQYSSSLDKFLYTIFFPVILIIMIIYILSARMFPNHKGISILLGISFIIFIVVYPPESEFSLYSAFAPIGTLWYLVVIVIGVFWILLGRILPSERGAGGPMAREGHMPGVARGGKGGLIGGVEGVLHEEQQRKSLIRQIQGQLNTLQRANSTRNPDIEAIGKQQALIGQNLAALKTLEMQMGLLRGHRGDHDRLVKRYEQIMEETI